MKIGLIAMSGIRACDPELLRLGLTLPGFVERSKVIASLPSLGLLTLAGMTPDRHECDYFEIEDLKKVDALPTGFDLVAISSYSAQIGEAYETARRYKKLGVPVVMGGVHVSALPDEAAQYCDAVAVGEGEACWLDILRDAENGDLQPVYRPGQCAFGLDDAPMPAFELLDIEKYNRLTVQTSRGCPHQCEFCAGSILLTQRYKQKPVAKVLAEVDRILEIWKRPFIEFADDNSFVNKTYWKELLTELKSRQIRWFTETDLTIHEDGELLSLLRDSGCVEVLIGFESPDESSLSGMELHNDWKRKHCSQYKDAVRNIQSHGIRVNGCFMFGLDAHHTDIFERVYDFARDTELFDVQITIQTPFPGTPLYHRLQEENRLTAASQWERCTLFDVNYTPRHMTVQELQEGFRNLGVRLYDDTNTAWRRETFNSKYLRRARRNREEKHE